MPNWCNNFANIRHEDPSEIERLAKAFNEGKFCNAVIPVPVELTETTSGHLGSGYAEELNQFKMQLNQKYFGHATWYDFCVNRWGTKWDFGADGYEADVDEDGLGMSITFDSAWSPPVSIWEELTAQGFVVDAMYYESGMAYCGRYTSEAGDNYWEIGEMSADEVADAIDPDIDECFGITESIREYEAENEEDLHKWVREGGEKLELKSA